jgi:hypothetical protein
MLGHLPETAMAQEASSAAAPASAKVAGPRIRRLK